MLNNHMISENFDKLFEAAKNVRDNAHVPYSEFKVGAAFLNRGQFHYCRVQCGECSIPTISMC